MRKAVAPPAMIKVAMIPATEPAIDVYVRAVNVGPVSNGLPGRGPARTDADQQQHQYCSRQFSPTIHRCPLLHPVVYVDVGRGVAGSVGQYAFACHLPVVRRDRARLDVRSTGGALERRLQTTTDQKDRRGRIAADAMGPPPRPRPQRPNIGVTLRPDQPFPPIHPSSIPPPQPPPLHL